MDSLFANKVHFIKMHGLANDFIIIQNFTPNNDAIKFLSNRKIGIGCDQLIVIDTNDGGGEFDVQIFNQDASKASACGNAMRCIAKLLQEIHPLRKSFILNVMGRRIKTHVLDNNLFSVNMGAYKICDDHLYQNQPIKIKLQGYDIEGFVIDVGNPHFVIVKHSYDVDEINKIGALMQKNKLFPDGINVNFANICDNYINLQVWERGVGLTNACGSGACASAVICHLFFNCKDDLTIKMQGGDLLINIMDGEVIMIGPATKVFEGWIQVHHK